MGPLFIVTERFDASFGESWSRYIAWSGLRQLSEVVSLDSLLCPSVLDEILDEDWSHIVNEDYMLRFFTDLDYLLSRCGDVQDRNLLCVFRNPEAQPSPPAGRREFRYEGCDLVDVHGDVSALTNCGGFPEAFSNDELSSHGLLASLERAWQAHGALRERYPEERHADCDVWSIFRAI
jgi:hypothetical protein